MGFFSLGDDHTIGGLTGAVLTVAATALQSTEQRGWFDGITPTDVVTAIVLAGVGAFVGGVLQFYTKRFLAWLHKKK